MNPAVLQALLNPRQSAPSLHPYHGRWMADGLLPALGEAQSATDPTQIARFVSPDAGAADASGLYPWDPYNPTSAAAGFAGDPFGQAFASLGAVTDASLADERRARCVYARAGVYPNPIAVTGTLPRNWRLYMGGRIEVPTGSLIAGRVAASAFGAPEPAQWAILPVVPWDLGLWLNAAGTNVVQVDDNSLGVDLEVIAQAAQFSMTIGAGGMTGQLRVTANACRVNDLDIGAPVASSLFASDTVLLGTPVISRLGVLERVSFDCASFVFTVNSADPNPIRACDFLSGAIAWTGPTAPWDGPTAERARAVATVTFAGGAGIDDFTAPDRETVGDVLVIPAGAAHLHGLHVLGSPRSISALRFWLVANAGGGACTLDVLSQGVSLLTAPIDLVTAATGIMVTVALAPGAVVALVRAGLLDFDINSGAGVVGGQELRVWVELDADTRPL